MFFFGSKQIPYQDTLMFWKCNFKRTEMKISDIFRQIEEAIFFHSLKTDKTVASAVVLLSPHAKEIEKTAAAKTFPSLFQALTHTYTHSLSHKVFHPLALKRIQNYIIFSLSLSLSHTPTHTSFSPFFANTRFFK